ncbi:MAG: hypothetical protein H6838_11200 [Planctomycetes bacterium]|nr:hypothetical protein [Planctomycetota bacterium]
MLYIATDRPLGPVVSDRLTIEEVEQPLLDELRSIFSKPSVRFVGVEGGCSCDFRHVLADAPFDYFDGMFDHEDPERRDRSDAVARELLAIIQAPLQNGGSVELYPTWAGERLSMPKGSHTMSASEVRPERFFFAEDHLYTVLP